MTYRIVLTALAEKHLAEWRKSGQKKTILKIVSLFEELSKHPDSGTGQPERLKGDLSGYWSRRIDKSNRLIYSIDGQIVTVTIISLLGHYGDK